MKRYFKSFNIVIILTISIVLACMIFLFMEINPELGKDEINLSEEHKKINESLLDIATFFDDSLIDGQACKASIYVIAYEMKKDALQNGHRYSSLYSNMAHTNILILTILIMIFVGLFFSIYQMATAYNSKIIENSEIKIEAANIKIQTGYVSIAITMIATIALSLYLSFAYEIKELSDVSKQLEFDIRDIIADCSNFIRK